MTDNDSFILKKVMPLSILAIGFFCVLFAHFNYLDALLVGHTDLGYIEFLSEAFFLQAAFLYPFVGSILAALFVLAVAKLWAESSVRRLGSQDHGAMKDLQRLASRSNKFILYVIFFLSGYGQILLYSLSDQDMFWYSFVIGATIQIIVVNIILSIFVHMPRRLFYVSRYILRPYAIGTSVALFLIPACVSIYAYNGIHGARKLSKLTGTPYEVDHETALWREFFTLAPSELPLRAQVEGLALATLVVILALWLIPAIMKRDYRGALLVVFASILPFLIEPALDWAKVQIYAFPSVLPNFPPLVIAVGLTVAAERYAEKLRRFVQTGIVCRACRVEVLESCNYCPHCGARLLFDEAEGSPTSRD